MRYEAEIKIPKDRVAEVNRLNSMKAEDGLVERLGYYKDTLMDVFSARFDNGYEADLRFCAGDTNFFIDPVLFDEDGLELNVLDCADDILGTFEFTDGFDDYVVKVTEI